MTNSVTQSNKGIGWLSGTLTLVLGLAGTPPLQAKCTDALYAAVTNRIGVLGSASSAEKSALVKARGALDKAALDLSAEVKALGTAATALQTVTNSAVITEEVVAGVCYFLQVSVQVNALSNRVAALPASGLKTAASNQLAQAYVALEKAKMTTTNVAVVAANLGVALTKVAVGNQSAAKAEFAPPSLHGKKVTVSVVNAFGERTSLSVTFVDAGYYIPPHGQDDAESGTFSFSRTSVVTATVALTSDPTEDNPSHTTTVTLTFTSATGGTLAGSSGNENFSGSFKLSNVTVDPPVAPGTLSGKTVLITVTQVSSGQRPTPFAIAFGVTTYTEAAHDGEPAQSGDYAYHRTGAKSAILLINHTEQDGLRTTVVQLTFTAAANGSFSFTSSGGDSGRGTFTVQ